MADEPDVRDFTFEHEKPYRGTGFDPIPDTEDEPLVGTVDEADGLLDSDSEDRIDGQTMEALGSFAGGVLERGEGEPTEAGTAEYLAAEAVRARMEVLRSEGR